MMGVSKDLKIKDGGLFFKVAEFIRKSSDVNIFFLNCLILEFRKIV